MNNGVPWWGERGWCCRSSFIRTGQRFFINRRAKSGTEGFSWWRRCFRSSPDRHSCQSSPAVDPIGWSWPVTDGYRQMVCPITFQVFFLFFFCLPFAKQLLGSFPDGFVRQTIWRVRFKVSVSMKSNVKSSERSPVYLSLSRHLNWQRFG